MVSFCWRRLVGWLDKISTPLLFLLTFDMGGYPRHLLVDPCSRVPYWRLPLSSVKDRNIYANGFGAICYDVLALHTRTFPLGDGGAELPSLSHFDCP